MGVSSGEGDQLQVGTPKGRELPREKGREPGLEEEQEKQERLDLRGCGQGRAPVFGSSPRGTAQEEFQGIPRHSTWVLSRQETEEAP